MKNSCSKIPIFERLARVNLFTQSKSCSCNFAVLKSSSLTFGIQLAELQLLKLHIQSLHLPAVILNHYEKYNGSGSLLSLAVV